MLFSALPLLLLLEQCTSARADIQPVRRDARQHHPRQLLSALGSGSDDSSPVSNAFTLALTHSNEPSTIDKLRDMVLKGRRKHPNHAAKFTQGVKQADGDEAEFDLDLAK